MKVAALMMVRNEATIVADSIGHLLHGVGVDRVFVADNGSTDATPAILSHLAADGRVKVTQAPGAYRQPEIMRTLLRQAMDDGADWLLPNDADEFLAMSGAELLTRCAAAEGYGALQLRVSNFAQLRCIRTDRPGVLRTMLFRAIPHGSSSAAESLVCEDGLPFLRIDYPTKLLARAAPDLVFHRGQHGAVGLAGPVCPQPAGELLHAPIRSRDDLGTRITHAERLNQVGTAPAVGWHLKRLLDMTDAELDDEWRKNSIGVQRPSTAGYVFDPRLARIGVRQTALRRSARNAVGSIRSA